jgi:hypothetical protein
VASQDIRILPGSSKFLTPVDIVLTTGLLLRAINLYNPPGTTTGIEQLTVWLATSNDWCIATVSLLLCRDKLDNSNKEYNKTNYNLLTNNKKVNLSSEMNSK